MTTRQRAWFWGAGLWAVGAACALLGVLLFPDSNLGGGLPVLGMPFLAVGFVMLVVLTIASIVEVLERRRRARSIARRDADALP